MHRHATQQNFSRNQNHCLAYAKNYARGIILRRDLVRIPKMNPEIHPFPSSRSQLGKRDRRKIMARAIILTYIASHVDCSGHAERVHVDAQAQTFLMRQTVEGRSD
jgi:hypothetical protein